MASLLDLVEVYAPKGPETGFVLADIERRQEVNKTTSGINRDRALRDYEKWDLPNLLGSQAARGAYNSSATINKRERAATGVSDKLFDITYNQANTEAELASNALLAQTGVRLGGSGY